MPNKILAFDFGSKTGWASWDGARIESGVQEFALNRGESQGMRFLRFNVWLSGILALVCPSLAVYEQAHHRGGHATDLLVGMKTRLEEHCARLGIEYTGVHSATLKKWATGSGRADKEKMVAAANSLVSDRMFSDDNEADALLLLLYAKEKFITAGDAE